MLQPLYLDVSKVDRVLHLFSSHLLLHRLSQSRLCIHTNEGWAMGVMGDAASRAEWALGGGLHTSQLGAGGACAW
jgi:hypothetical protein